MARLLTLSLSLSHTHTHTHIKHTTHTHTKHAHTHSTKHTKHTHKQSTHTLSTHARADSYSPFVPLSPVTNASFGLDGGIGQSGKGGLKSNIFDVFGPSDDEDSDEYDLFGAPFLFRNKCGSF